MSALLLLSVLCPLSSALAGAFSGNARVEISDPTGGLSWNTNVSKQLTVQCWFKISIPSGVMPKDNMTILVNRTTGGTSDPHAYYLWFDKNAFNIQFSTQGAKLWKSVLIPESKFYLDRWYHVAVVRNDGSLTAYVDGQLATSTNLNVGDSHNTNGVSIGGWGDGKYLYGEVQEVSIYKSALPQSAIYDLRFSDQGIVNDLRGYFKLRYSNDPAERYKNFASNKPTGTDSGTKQGSGDILFEETDRKGEQSLFDSMVNGGQNAIMPLSGGFAWQHSCFSRPAPGVAFDFMVGYSPAAANNDLNDLGRAWSHCFAPRIVPEYASTLHYKVITWQGGVDVWDRSSTTSPFTTRHGEYRGELNTLATGEFEWTTPQRLVYRFSEPSGSGTTMGGRLMEIRDFKGNSLQFLWDTNVANAYITNVLDSTGGSYRFWYDGQLLTNITYGAWQVRFGYTNGCLASKTLTNTSGLYTNVAATWRFYYNTNGLLERIVNPCGNDNLSIRYDEYGRRINTINALGDATSTEYGAPGNRQIRTTDPGGYQWVDTYDRKGRVVSQRDPLGNETRYAYDQHGNRAAITDPRGNTTLLGYDERGNVIAQTNALGEVTRWTYHPFFNKPLTQTDPAGWTTTNTYDGGGNLLSRSDALGTLASNTYTTNGLVLTATDANRHTTTNAYNADGFVTAQTDAAGFTTHFQPNELGWNLRTINARSEETTYAYDLNGKVIRTADALGRTFFATYDACGDLLSQTDGKGQETSYTYDALRRKTKETDRANGISRFYYTPRGKLDRSRNALSLYTHYQYDAANRQTAIVDPLGNTTTTVYDAGGNAVAMIDPLERRWTRTFDPLNRVVAESDPFGDITQTFYDAAGRVRETIAPNGSRTVNAYDGRGRLTNWVDATGSSWHYAYDGVGNITNIIDAKGGQYAMAYGPRNERILERNQGGKEWHYYYDALRRLQTQIEPNGTERNLAYDPGGRLTQVTFNTGRVNFFAYDPNDNPTYLARSGSGPPTSSQLAYDAMDRVQSYGDTSGNNVGYAYDAAGRMTNLTYPDGKALTYAYDGLDRLTNQVFNFGPKSFTNSFAYDQADQLVRRVYPNGIVQTNTFDGCGHLTGLSHSALNPQPSTLNIAFAYAYDRNGNTIRSRPQGRFAGSRPAPLDETSRFTAANQITSRVDALTPTNNFTYQYDARGNMTNAFGGGQNWTLTYDEDNRATSIQWEADLTSKVITNRYDALGRRIARTVDGVETRYVLDLAGGMERILCDVTAAGTITCWYVHGADLSFKVAPDGTLTCYHADVHGNVIALTGTGGTNLIEYAYTPYGRSLGSTNYSANPALDTQPFLFAGSQGVMMEERGVPGLFFMRARYYSANAGVFLSTDPVKNIGPTWRPIAYCYANGNPLRFNDPTGELVGLDDFIGFVGGAIIGGIVDFTVQMIKHHGRIGDVNWGEFGGAVAAGAITGLATTLTAGMGTGAAAILGGIVINAAAGVAGEIALSAASNGNLDQLSGGNLLSAGIVGGLGGPLGSLAGGGVLKFGKYGLSSPGAKKAWGEAQKLGWKGLKPDEVLGRHGLLETHLLQQGLKAPVEALVGAGSGAAGYGLSWWSNKNPALKEPVSDWDWP